MALNPEIDAAIEDITNESIIKEEGEDTVQIILDDINDGGNLKQILTQEFQLASELLDFNTICYDLFKRWYVDGRLYFHAIIDEQNPMMGIQELRYIDPRKIRKVREMVEVKDKEGVGIILKKVAKEYYVYNDRGFTTQGNKSLTAQSGTTGVKIAKDTIVHTTSGIVDTTGKLVLSYLHKAIRPLNQLRALEDATIIYRISRAPERRVFYIDTGTLPKAQADAYLRDMMIRHKNRMVYDAATGEIRDDRKFVTMLEDYWIPRREGGKGTEIDTLPAGQNLGELQDVQYFQRKLYKSLNVPISRLEPETVYNVGRATEITRDEVKFAKFIDRLRTKFSELFLKVLERQLILKGIMQPEEWDQIEKKIKFKFLRDNYFAELKQQEIWRERANMLQMMDMFAGKYFSHIWIRKEVLKQTEKDISEINMEIEAEAVDPQYNPPMELPAGGGGGEGGFSSEQTGPVENRRIAPPGT